MNIRYKIIGMIGMLLCVLQPVSAQFRMGIESSYGIPKSYSDYHGYDEDYMPTVYAGLSFEYVFPRRIMPLNLPLSIKTGVGYAHYEESPEDFGNKWGDVFWGQGIGIPLTAELKYLISNYVRAYVNAGVTFNYLSVDFISEEDYEYGYDYGYGTKWKFMMGGTAEVGIELRNYRIGCGFRKLFSSFNGFDGEEKPGSIFISMGWRFGGNRLFKKTSKLNVY